MSRKADKLKSASRGGRGGGRFMKYFCAFVLVGGLLLAWPSVLTFSASDPPSPNVWPPPKHVHNAVGVVGAHVAYSLRYWLGVGTYAGLFFATVAAVLLLFGAKIRDLPWRIAGVVLLVLATSSAAYVLKPGAAADMSDGSAGIVGMAAGRFVLDRFNPTGSYIIIAVTLCVGLALAAESLVLRLPRVGQRIWSRRGAVVNLVGGGGRMAARFVGASAKAVSAGSRALRATGARPASASAAGFKAGPTAARVIAPGGDKPPRTGSPVKGAAPAGFRPPAPAQPPVASRAEPPARPVPKPAGQPAEPARKTPVFIPQPSNGAAAQNAPGRRYELPSTDLLAEPTGNFAQAQEQQAAANQEVLQQTFRDFNVDAQVVGYQTGPVITLFEIALAPGVKVAQISNLATDIARALAVPGVRVVPPRFGKDTIGVEIPNLKKEMVRIKELMGHAPKAEKEMHLPLYLGKDAGGNPIVADLAGMPHMLIAGTTGSGKSVCINSIIISLLMTRSPEDVRLILVDPKMVEMAAFDNIPHLPCPIVHDMGKAEEILEWAATKMDERYELLKEANVKNIASFNRLSREDIYKRFDVSTAEEKAQVPTRLPYYVIIIDELADLIMTADREVETHIIRIAQKARAVGIHLILATQRPSVNVVTGLIKSNMPCRVSFRVASRQESRIVLDQNGAEVLLGQGDMLFLQPGNSTLVRAQGTYVEDSEIKTVVNRLREKGGPQYEAELMRLDNKPGEGAGGEKDELFDQAVEIVLATQRGSVSLLQRRLQVGYSRASRIIDQMADAGILGDYKGSQARECLMSVEDWRDFKKSVAADHTGASAVNGEPTSS
jgi:DNA segregation ATPase FtsK/SpoIIIE, S-DNA-T family